MTTITHDKVVGVLFGAIGVDELEPFIRRAFVWDADLLGLFHISPGDLDHCTRHTYDRVREGAEEYGVEVECYALYSESGIPIGFTVFACNSLYSFGINSLYRKTGHVEKWLAQCENMCGGGMGTVLNAKNTRAVKFFIRNGYEIVPQYGAEIVFLRKIKQL